MELTALRRGHGTGYQPTPLEDVDYWYKHLPRAGVQQRTLVDIGCGKGVVLRRWQERAAQDGWCPTVVGIESDPLLAATARLQVKRYRSSIRRANAVTFDYASLGGPLLIWLFNPFNAGKVRLLLPRLRGLDVWVIANNPEHVAVLQDDLWVMQAYWWRGEQENTWFWLSNSSQPVHVKKVAA